MMLKQNNNSDSAPNINPRIDPKEIKRVIKESVIKENVYCEVNLDGEELNPFKPITIANWNTSN